jgi:DMSO/TMAO reductase YedYZ heme-binding membrane subunit
MIRTTPKSTLQGRQHVNGAALLQVAVHVAAWMPLAALALDHARNGLGANPIQAITLRTGKTALVLLVLSLTVTPLATFGWRGAVQMRSTGTVLQSRSVS